MLAIIFDAFAYLTRSMTSGFACVVKLGSAMGGVKKGSSAHGGVTGETDVHFVKFPM